MWVNYLCSSFWFSQAEIWSPVHHRPRTLHTHSCLSGGGVSHPKHPEQTLTCTHTREENMQTFTSWNWTQDLLAERSKNVYFILNYSPEPLHGTVVWFAPGGCCAPPASRLLYEPRVTKETTTGGWWVFTQQARQEQEEPEPLCSYSLQNVLNTWFNDRFHVRGATLERR